MWYYYSRLMPNFGRSISNGYELQSVHLGSGGAAGWF